MASTKLPPPSPYIEVAVTLPVFGTYTYAIPDHLAHSIAIGKRVLVPFGRRLVTGFILEQLEATDLKDVRPIQALLDETPLFPASLLPFYRWIANYYLHPIGHVIKSALPGGLTLIEITQVDITDQGKRFLAVQREQTLEVKILSALSHGPSSLKDLRNRLGQALPRTTLDAMAAAGLIGTHERLHGGQTRPKTERYAGLAMPGNASDLPPDKLSAPKRELLAILKARGNLAIRDLRKVFPTAARHLKALERAGHVRLFDQPVYRDPFGDSIEPSQPPAMTTEQMRVIEQVTTSLGRGFATFLLAGVTGSGKTEVYLHVAAETIRRGYNVLILVPEIALISQMERRFRARFGDRIAVLHSGLSAGERFDQWQRILRREVSIAIGARSAIFAPFKDIGVVIVDEEHDTSYKQEGSLSYNARDLAVVRAKLQDGITLLGSATPSVQSYFNAAAGKYVTARLTKRIEYRSLPEVTVVDLRTSRDSRGYRRIITQPLYQALRSTLADGEQALLFLNRRGFASYPVCAACGAAIKCPNCDISLTLHQSASSYKCHYCGFARAVASTCPVCAAPHIKNLGLGTEKIEALVKSLFPDARVARMDADTTAKKGALLGLLKGLRNRTIDILVGTQMVAKGHDFPHITLVGILCADLSLNFPDFRAGERTFQLLAQVSGRAGRGTSPGRVILQTYNPQHFSIAAAEQHDFELFCQQELRFRKELNYPPFTRMVQIKLACKDPALARKHAHLLGDTCRGLRKDGKDFIESVEILGPIEAPVSRIAGFYRWQILLKGHPVKTLHRFTHKLIFEKQAMWRNRHVRVAVDVDPFFMM